MEWTSCICKQWNILQERVEQITANAKLDMNLRNREKQSIWNQIEAVNIEQNTV